MPAPSTEQRLRELKGEVARLRLQMLDEVKETIARTQTDTGKPLRKLEEAVARIQARTQTTPLSRLPQKKSALGCIGHRRAAYGIDLVQFVANVMGAIVLGALVFGFIGVACMIFSSAPLAVIALVIVLTALDKR